MGLLDDLKQEAERRKQDLTEDEARKARSDAFYEENLRPKLLAIFNYLTEMTENLNFVKPDIRVGYEVPGFGVIPGLQQLDYVVNADSVERMSDVQLRFRCKLPQEAQFSVRPRDKAEQTRQFLSDRRFRFADWPVRDFNNQIVGLSFQVPLDIEVVFRFTADRERGRINLLHSNFDGFTVKRQSFRPEQIGDEWLDRLGHYLLRKRDELQTLDISDQELARIRARTRQLAAERKRELEARLEAERRERERQAQQPRSLFERLRLGRRGPGSEADD